jgi:hypothetical protein
VTGEIYLDKESVMNQRTLAAWIMVNVVLLSAVLLTWFGPSDAQAQFDSSNQYVMLSGSVVGRTDLDAVYIVDLDTMELVAATIDTRRKNAEIDFVASRNIQEDLTRDGGK